MIRVLLVEDEDARVAWFRQHEPNAAIQHVRTVPKAIAALQSGIYEWLWLDHDLGTEPAAGRDVATWLVAHPDCNPWLRIQTHTVNAVSGPKIVRDLQTAGRDCRWVPFSQLAAAPVTGS